jgi:hypothetical protein
MKRLLQKLNSTKAAGPDIKPRALNELVDKQAPFLTIILNRSINTGEFLKMGDPPMLALYTKKVIDRLYWIPKLHENLYKQRYIVGSSQCSTKPLSLLLTKLLTAIKESLQRYCSTAYSRSGVNQMK